MLVDTHSHVPFEEFRGEQEEVLARARAAGVEVLISVGCDAPTSAEAVRFADAHPGVYATVGIHPHEVGKAAEDAWREVGKLLGATKVVAVGEVGLDYYRDYSPREVQKTAFRRQLAIARKFRKPVVIHCREAFGDCLGILREDGVPAPGGVMHCYSGGVEMVDDFLELGFFISIAGPVTFPNARKLREVAQAVPLERLVLETDCPYLAPQAHRGKRNEPAYLRYTWEEVARVRGEPPELVEEQTTRNAFRLFGLPKEDHAEDRKS